MSNLAPRLSLLYLKVMVGMPDSHVQKIPFMCLQVLAIEFVAFAIEFVPLVNEFVTLAIEFVHLA